MLHLSVAYGPLLGKHLWKVTLQMGQPEYVRRMFRLVFLYFYRVRLRLPSSQYIFRRNAQIEKLC